MKPFCKKTVRAKIIKKGSPFQFEYKTYKARYGKPSANVDPEHANSAWLYPYIYKQSEPTVVDVAHVHSKYCEVLYTFQFWESKTYLFVII